MSLSCAAARSNHPTAVVFDLDPGPTAALRRHAEVALWLREFLESAGLSSVPKTSGKKGLQIYVPLNTGAATYDETKLFRHAVAVALSPSGSIPSACCR